MENINHGSPNEGQQTGTLERDRRNFIESVANRISRKKEDASIDWEGVVFDENISSACKKVFDHELNKFNKFCEKLEFDDVLDFVGDKGNKIFIYGWLINAFAFELPPDVVRTMFMVGVVGISARVLQGADDFANYADFVVSNATKGLKIAIEDFMGHFKNKTQR